MSSWEKISHFIATHRAAVLIGSATVICSTAGVYYYYNSIGGKPVKKSKKKPSNEKKKSKKEASSSKTIAGFPIVKVEGGVEVPEIPSNFNFKKLSEENRQLVADKFKAAGNDFYGKSDYENALIYYQKALDVIKNPIFYSNRAACYARLGQHEKVIEEATKALKIQPKYFKCVVRRGLSYEHLGKYEDALLDFTSGLILNGFEDRELTNSVDRILKLCASTEAKKIFEARGHEFPSPAFVHAYYLTSVNLAVLPDFLDVAVEEDSAEYDIKLAIEALRKGSIESLEQALDYFNSAVEKGGDHLYYSLAHRGTLRYFRCEYESADEDLSKSIELKPTVLAYITKSSLSLELGDIASTQLNLVQAEKEFPSSPYVYFHNGQLKFLAEQVESALKDFEKALELDPELMMASVQYGVGHYRLGNVDKATEVFEDLQHRFPLAFEPYNYFGEIMLDRNMIDKAHENFDKAISIATNKSSTGHVNVVPLVNKALVYIQTGKSTEAIDICRKAIALDPRSDLPHTTLAQIYMQLQNNEEAVKELRKSAETARTMTEISQHLAIAIATKTQVRISNERPEYKELLDEFKAKSQAAEYARMVAQQG